ncbi:hypothetical protein ENBRE01_2203 [Enteropsectra breve]|nr:hypothetical protein ENBRE01_2203 [Enteropsectra breve]
MDGLVDTGADISCMKKKIANKIKLKSNKHEIVKTADGKIAQDSRSNELELKVGGITFNTSFPIIENLSHEIIIGMYIIQSLIKKIGLNGLFKDNESIPNVNSIIEEFKAIMRKDLRDLKTNNLPEFRIDTGNHPPIVASRYRLGKPQDDMIEEEITKLLETGIIRRSNSPWASPVVLVPKKDGRKRLCIDYRAINDITTRDAYPLPRIDEILDTLSGASVYTNLDATSGYHQIPVAKDDINKTAFQTRSGLYEYTRMPFGLSNAPAAFQRAMDELFKEEKGKFVQIYLDDIIVYSKTKEDHEQHLKTILAKLKEGGLILNQEKCNFFKEELTILGYKVSKNTIQPTEERIQGIYNFPTPTTIQELRSFLGLMSYCRSFIKNLASKTSSLNILLKGSPSASTKIILTPEQISTFEELKTLINDKTKLTLPDYEKPFIITTDASSKGLSGILAQKQTDGTEHPIQFFSKSLNEAQQKYSATQLELLAIVETLRHFKAYLLHKKFIIRTDHQALTALKHTKNLNSMLFRWSLFLSDFVFDLEYIKGQNNPADALSRTDKPIIASITQPRKSIITDDELKKQLILAYHIKLGHGSAGNMIYNLSQKYEWKGLYSQVHQFVDKCHTCLRASNKVSHTNYHRLQSNKAGDLIVIDTVGPLPNSTSGNKFIITAVDHYTKYAWAMAVPQKSAECVKKFIQTRILTSINNINSFLSDNGLEFRSSITQEIANVSGIKWKFGSPYHPETQGAVERFNDTILKKIRKLSNFNHKAWDRVVDTAVEAYNFSYHRAIGSSPHENLNQHRPIFDIDKDLVSSNFKSAIPGSILKSTREDISSEYNKEFSGSTTAPSKFKIGDKVLKYNFSPSLSKIDSHWDAGFTIISESPCGEAYVLRKDHCEFRANKAHLKLDVKNSL